MNLIRYSLPSGSLISCRKGLVGPKKMLAGNYLWCALLPISLQGRIGRVF